VGVFAGQIGLNGRARCELTCMLCAVVRAVWSQCGPKDLQGVVAAPDGREDLFAGEGGVWPGREQVQQSNSFLVSRRC